MILQGFMYQPDINSKTKKTRFIVQMSLSGCISHDEIMNNQLVNMLIVVLQLVLVNSCEK